MTSKRGGPKVFSLLKTTQGLFNMSSPFFVLGEYILISKGLNLAMMISIYQGIVGVKMIRTLATGLTPTQTLTKC